MDDADMADAALLQLADRVEIGPASRDLDCAVGAAIENMEEPGSVVRRNNGYWKRALAGRSPQVTLYRPPHYTSEVEAASSLEPGDAREVCIRLFSNGGAHVHIVLSDGRVAECESIDREISEARARTACALRALALMEDDPPVVYPK